MFDLINGLPVHPLVVHGVAVLLPLAGIGAIAVALKPSWRLRYGWLLVGISAVATALIPIATSSGEALEKHVGDPGRHAALGEQLIWVALPLLLFTTGMVWLEHRKAADKPALGPGWLPRAVATLAIVAALATSVQVYRIGDSGAHAAWGDQVSASAVMPARRT